MEKRRLLICFLFITAISFLTAVDVFAQEGAGISGVVHDPRGGVVSGAKVSIFGSRQILAGSAVTNEVGEFEIWNLTVGSYELVIEQSGFATYRSAVRLAKSDDRQQFEITLSTVNLSEGVTVTAVVNEVQDIFESSQQIGIITAADIARRPAAILPQFFQEETGLHMRQLSTYQGTIVIRGLTGQRVVTLIDGVRFNNSTFGTGINQYIGLIDSSIVNKVEIVHGPGSAQYGSDSLGGTVNVLSERPKFFSKGFEIHGDITAFFGSADLSSGGNFKLGLGNSQMSLVLSGFGRRVNDLRPGAGVDSHSVVTRFFGLPSSLLGDRLQDTGFTQYGGFSKLVWKPVADQQLTLFYHRSDQRGARRYDLLNGGAGAIIGNLTPQVLDFFYTRYEKQELGILDSISGTFSFNRQRDNFEIQFGTPFSPITYQFSRRDAFGYEIQGTTHIGSRQFLTFGGELYDEHVDIREVQLNPVTGISGPLRRPSFPDESKYQSYGAFIQDSADILPGRLSVNGGIRYSAFFFKTFADKNPLDSRGKPTVPDSSYRADDITFNFGTSYFINQSLSLTGTISRGFRAPNIIDLGSLGNTVAGFEVSADEAAKLGGMIGTTADLNARSTGKRVSPLDPENLFNYEVGAKFQNRRAYATFAFFNSDVNDFILKRTLILPQGAVGKTIGGEKIILQDPATGSIRVEGAGDSRPVVVTVNAAEIRIYGIETSAQINLADALTLSGNFSYLRGEDKNPSLRKQPVPGVISIIKAPDAPDISGGLPPVTGFFSLRYQPQGKRYWIEAYSNLASKQDRLSSIDLADLRIGANRSRGLISFFFAGRARSLGLIGNGPDNRPFTPDDVLLATGETLQQIQDRVLGKGIISAPFYLSTPGYATFNLRGGYKLNEHSDLTFILENVLDKNYRLHGSGIDAAGINLVVRYSWRF